MRCEVANSQWGVWRYLCPAMMLVSLVVGGCGDSDSGSADAESRTPEDALWYAAEEGDLEEVERLIAEGVDVNYQRPNNKGGNMALHRAADQGHVEVVRALIDAGADVHAEDFAGRHPLRFAAKEHADVVAVLIEHGADVDHAVQMSGPAGALAPVRPLHRAAGAGNVESVRLLLEAGAEVDPLKGEAGTPLFFAASQGRTEVVELLIEAGADVNAPKDDGQTPLMTAAMFGHQDVIELLIEAGADPTLTTEDGQTAADLARETEQEEVADFLDGL